MHLEAVHRSIKYAYLSGKQCIRLDETIYQLLRLIRNKKYERIIKIEKSKPTKIYKDTAERYQKSKDYVELVQSLGTAKWIVKSKTDKNKIYEVITE